MSRRLLLLAMLTLGCKDPAAILAEAEPAATTKLKQLKAVCAAYTAAPDAAPKAAKPPEPLVALEPRLDGAKINAMVMDAAMCSTLDLNLDDKSKSLGASRFEFGYPHPIFNLADVYLRDNSYTRAAYDRGSYDAAADTRALEQLRYVIIWTTDTLDLPKIDAEDKSFAPGRFKGRALLYKLDGAKLLSVSPIEAENTPDVTIMSGEHVVRRQEQVYTKERVGGAGNAIGGGEYEETPSYKTRTTERTVNLGPWESAAARDLMLDLSSAAERAAKRAVPYTTPPS